MNRSLKAALLASVISVPGIAYSFSEEVPGYSSAVYVSEYNVAADAGLVQDEYATTTEISEAEIEIGSADADILNMEASHYPGVLLRQSDEFEAAAVSNYELSGMSGAFNPEQLGIAVFDAKTVNTSSNNAVTGFNSIANGALGNSQGLVSVVQNTGNNVIIQNATIVNLTLKQ